MTCGSTKGLKAHSDELRLTRAAEVCCAEKRKFPISAETQPSAEATCVKIRSCESALRVDTFFVNPPYGQSDFTVNPGPMFTAYPDVTSPVQMSSRVDCFVSQTLNAASWKFFDPAERALKAP